ncbi:hypothetical protein [Sporosarcina koreensis]|uniref:hypothetical protein n=1 Tax=Sporosarcina koreensis TaxID=334735 RepID=UPI000B193D2B|nr:hypothetical protein [Sporosarcina koreensis]
MDFTVTIADNHGVYDEWQVTNFRVSADSETVAVEYVDSRGELAYKITSVDNFFAE